MLLVEETNQSSLDRRQIIRRKVMAIGKMSRAYTVLKDCPELVNQLKALSANGKIPPGILSQGEQAIKEAITALTVNKHKLSSNTIKEHRDHPLTLHNYSTPNYKITTGNREGHV
ncbi:hypothetical protein G6F56_012398 [Rhizopus delemar]|nr:hypothetical protein G6F56_012398 [Rhizopus delemar]